jgi:hypothetical protein
MSEDKPDQIFRNVTRYSTDEERAAVDRIDISAEDLEEVMKLVRRGLLEAALVHEGAVQENFALRVETSVRLSRPVYNEESDQVEELVSRAEVDTTVNAHKIFNEGADPEPNRSA